MRRIAWCGAAIGAVVAMLSVSNNSNAAPQNGADLPVIGQVKSAASYNKAAGTLTAVLRSVEVSGRTMTVKFAVQWDNADTSAPEYENFDPNRLHWDVRDLTVIDTTNLTAYRPLCTKGSYKIPAEEHPCLMSQLSWPKYNADVLVNHALAEGSAILPAPEGKPATVDVALGAPFPTLTAIPVTYR